MIKETIGQRLRRIRLKLGLTQREIERRTEGEISNATVCHIETGWVQWPSCATVEVIAKALGVCPCILAGWKEE